MCQVMRRGWIPEFVELLESQTEVEDVTELGTQMNATLYTYLAIMILIEVRCESRYVFRR